MAGGLMFNSSAHNGKIMKKKKKREPNITAQAYEEDKKWQLQRVKYNIY